MRCGVSLTCPLGQSGTNTASRLLTLGLDTSQTTAAQTIINRGYKIWNCKLGQTKSEMRSWKFSCVMRPCSCDWRKKNWGGRGERMGSAFGCIYQQSNKPHVRRMYIFAQSPCVSWYIALQIHTRSCFSLSIQTNYKAVPTQQNTLQVQSNLCRKKELQ